MKPKDRKIFGSKWIYRKKESINEKEAPTYKARLVSRGFSQKKRIDYNENFSSVIKHTFIWVLLSLMAQHDMELEQLDMKSTFLQRDLEETTYMAQQEEFMKAERKTSCTC